MHATFFLALAQAALVTVAPSPDDYCPSAAQVRTALDTHAPRLVLPRPDDDPAGQLVLNLASAQSSREVAISLLDAKGRVRLYRALPPPPGDRARDCAALADTIALIVDRYFSEVELPSLPDKKPPPASPPQAPLPQPPSPPPTPGIPAESFEPSPESPSTTLSFNVGRRFPGGAVDLGGIEFKLALSVELATVGANGWPLWGELSGGIVGIANHGWDYKGDLGSSPGSASLVRSGGDLAVLLGRPTGRGKLYLGPLFSVEVIWLDATSNSQIQHEVHTGLAGGLRTGYQYFWRARFFARADLTACLAILRQRIVTASHEDLPIFAAPPAYATLSLGIGIWF